jgi:hypothetical protein
MRGGTLNPAIGSPYNAGAAQPSGNHYPLSGNGIPSGQLVPPVPSNNQFGGFHNVAASSGKGGRRTKNRRGSRISKNMRGGGLSSFMSTILPDDVVNAARSVPAAFGHFADRFNGLNSMPSSMVYPTDQLQVYRTADTAAAKPAFVPSDIGGIYQGVRTALSGQ